MSAPTQDKIYQHIVKYKQENNGNSPTYQEIADALELSKQTVYNRIQRLIIRRRLDLDQNQRIVVPTGMFVLKTSL